MYEGSLTIDADLMASVGLIPYEKICIYNINNGERLETYVIKGIRGSGEICLNGPAARKAQVGDIIIIISYGMIDIKESNAHQPTIIFPDTNNRLT
jgi:aspartate 1-decarboxylase